MINEVFNEHPIEQMTCAMIGVLEIISVLVRKRNDGRLSTPFFKQAMLELGNEIIENKAFPIASTDDSLIFSAMDLIAKHNINATDSIILRSCITIQQDLQEQGHELVLMSSDKRLVRAGKDESIEVFDPEIDTLPHLQKLLKASIS